MEEVDATGAEPTNLAPDSRFCCYLLASATSARTYIGATVHVARRLRQHNGELQGGARATASGRPWRIHAVCTGFNTWRQALRFEWRWKHRSPRRRGGRRVTRGIAERVARAEELRATPPFEGIAFVAGTGCRPHRASSASEYQHCQQQHEHAPSGDVHDEP